jgi:signal transduction histidine kinase
MIFFAWSAAATAETKRVVLLHSFGRDFKPWGEYARSIRTELERRSPWRLDITDHSLMTARFSDENPEVLFVEYLLALFAKQAPDLIVSIGAPAASFVQRNRQQLFGRIPMLFTAVEQRRIKFTELTTYDTVVAVAHNFPAIVENILHVLPDTKLIAVVTGDSPNERFWSGEIRREVQPFEKRVAFKWFTGLSFQEMLEQSSALPPHSAIYWFLMSVDGAGISHEGAQALRRLHDVANAPIFSDNESFFGGDLVGGPMHSVGEGADQAVSVALRILSGEKPSDIKLPPTRYATPKFDWRELQRWGISESRLPAGSTLHFREPTAWERYRWQIVLVAVALLGQSLLIGGLFYQRRRRRLAEGEVRHRMSELEHMNRSAAAGEMSASIAHEINQPLAAMVTSGNAGLRWLTRELPDVERAIVAFNRIIADGHRASRVATTVRGMFKKDVLERETLDVNKVLDEVLDFARLELDRYQVSVTRGPTHVLPLVLGNRIQLQQVVLNLVRNAAEAMSSTTDRRRILQVTSEVNEAGDVVVGIRDTGPGIDPNNADRIFGPFFTTKPTGMGMGLSICRSIVESHGGRLSAVPNRPYGAFFQIILPLDGKDSGVVGASSPSRAATSLLG